MPLHFQSHKASIVGFLGSPINSEVLCHDDKYQVNEYVPKRGRADKDIISHTVGAA